MKNYKVEIYNNLDDLVKTMEMTEAELLKLMREFDNSFGCRVYQNNRRIFSINM